MSWNEPGGNNRDPWKSGNKENGPPDLDEVLKSLQKKFARVFGGNGGQSEQSGSGGTFGFTFILVIALVIWALSGIFIVSPAEQGVILRFGKYLKTVNPGPHWIPRFIDKKYIVDVQKVSNFSYTSHMLTQDENIVDVSLAVQYRVDEPNNFLFNAVAPRQSIQQATASALRAVVGHTTLDNILTIGRAAVRSNVVEALNEILERYKVGLSVTDITMQPAKAPEEVKEAFDDAIKAQEDEQRYINQAQAYARGVEPIAEGNAKRMLQEAEAYKQGVTLKAKGDIARFLAILPEYHRAPRVTRERLYLEAIESVLGQTNKVLVDVQKGNNLFYLPLDRLTSNKSDALPREIAPLAMNEVAKTTSRNASKVPYRATRDTYRGRERIR